MPVAQPPTGPIEISDPNNVPEQFISGPFNIMNAGGMVHITLTTARPNPNDLFRGSTTPQFQATVACRLLMPFEMAEQLTRTLADTLIKARQAPARRQKPSPDERTNRTTSPTEYFQIAPDFVAKLLTTPSSSRCSGSFYPRHPLQANHVDLSCPNPELWVYLAPFIESYDAVVTSLPEYGQKLNVPQRFIMPAINPFSTTNKELSPDEIEERLTHYGIPTDLPLVVQISRFDNWKDPQGVVKAFQIARKHVDCTLVLLGNVATDDPEGHEVFASLCGCAEERIRILLVQDSALVNALQRRATVGRSVHVRFFNNNQIECRLQLMFVN